MKGAPVRQDKQKSQASRRAAQDGAAASRLAALDAIFGQAIRENQIPGAVAVVGHGGQIVYRKAFGFRALEPRREPMTLDTVFDIASLTKPIATATSVMRMVELGQVRLNDPVAKYLPDFGKYGKDEITIRQLLTHFSGLREDLDLKQRWEGKETAYRLADEEKPVTPPGAQFRYSDINYIVLGELVERLSGMPLDKYADAHVFQPLGMTETGFGPQAGMGARVAPTEYDETNRMLRGVVHDPTARRMGGVAGHAGVFSTADDVAKFAEAMLESLGPHLSNDGLHGPPDKDMDSAFPLSPATAQKMTMPQTPPTATVMRGLGWDIDSPFSSNRGELLPVGSFGHTGFTGTSLWIDPTTDTYIIIMGNAVHPRLRPGAPMVSIRTKVASAVAAALSLEVTTAEKMRLASLTGYNEAMVGTRRMQSRNGQVKTGIDVLVERNFDLLNPKAAEVAQGGAPRRIGLLTNQNGVDAKGRRTIDLLAHAPGIELAAIFSPEHGIAGALDTTNIPNGRDERTGVTIYSLYGPRGVDRRPSAESLRNLDAIVVDVQEVGARFFTYGPSLGYLLEAAAQTGIEIIVLDRPNPINGAAVQGPISNSRVKVFANYHPLPVRHGMTLGELARLYNSERGINAKLTVIAMQGWQRGDWWDSTGVTWINPSPNMRSVNEATLYPGVALIEGTNVATGRGTDTPFEVMGAPWMDAVQFAAYLNERLIPGVRFVPVKFTPKERQYSGEVCKGVNIIVTDRNQLDSPELGIELAVALRKVYPQQWDPSKMNDIVANETTVEAVKRGEDPRRIADEWRDEIDAFMKIRAKYLLY